MVFFLLTVLFVFLSYRFSPFIKKHTIKIYTTVFLINAVEVFLVYYFRFNKIRLQGLALSVENLFSRGIIGTALISVVMLIGIMDNKKHFVKKLRSIRGELSIISCFFILPHNIIYMVSTLMNFSKIWNSKPSVFKTVTLFISVSGIITVSLLIPLFITSFIAIRKKMKAKSWKKLQKLSYPFYALIYIQIMLVHLGYDNRRRYLEALFYSLIFLPYFILRVKKHFSDKKNIRMS